MPAGARRADWPWLVILLAAALVFACLALITINAGSGFVIDGRLTRFRLVSAVTNYPFCPPEIPCPVSVILDKDHWVVWSLRYVEEADGVETTFRKLIDVPLW